MPVYMIQAGEDGPVKIGYADDPVKRLSELQVAHYRTLRIIRILEGTRETEATLHDRFLDLRMRGEWFSFSSAMLGNVGTIDVPREQEPEIPDIQKSKCEYLSYEERRIPHSVCVPRIVCVQC